MGWVWIDDARHANSDSHAVAELQNPRNGDSHDVAKFQNPSNGDCFSTRRIVQSNCRTEEVEPGKFVRKCEKTEEVLRDCLGKPTEVVQSTKEYTEEDITGKTEPFDFGELRNDIKAVERSFFDVISSFFDTAEEMKKDVFSIFDDLSSFGSGRPSSSSRSRSIPIEDHGEKHTALKRNNSGSGDIDLSGLARDV